MSEEKANPKAHLVFVHGASHGAWCWYKIRSFLETAGYSVICLDLAGAGIDLTDPNTVLTFEQHNRPLFDFFSTLPPGEKVIVVAHSAAGSSLTYALCNFTNQISMAIYVAAGMEKPGSIDHSVNLWYRRLPPLTEVFDCTYALGEDQPPTSIIMKKEYQRVYYYNLSPLEDSTLASMLLRPTPARASLRDLGESKEAELVPRVFIKTLQDRIIDPSKQDEMIRKWPPSLVFTLDSDHSPFFSAPEALFNFLLQAIASLKSA